ncbi:MAG: energy transducer TonB [Gemmatimonadaceae bacterium]
MAKRGNPPPRFPEIAIQAKIRGDVLVQFVIDTSGAPDFSTVKVLRANYQDFVQEVVKVLPQHRFEPGTIDGCRVKMWVQLPFDFDLRD